MRNRFNEKPTNGDLKNYIRSTKGLKNSYERFACFQFLCHLAEVMDIDTAMNMARCV